MLATVPLSLLSITAVCLRSLTILNITKIHTDTRSLGDASVARENVRGVMDLLDRHHSAKPFAKRTVTILSLLLALAESKRTAESDATGAARVRPDDVVVEASNRTRDGLEVYHTDLATARRHEAARTFVRSSSLYFLCMLTSLSDDSTGKIIARRFS